MKTLIAVVLLLTACAISQDQVHNGVFWRGLPQPMKTAYVVGHSDGRCAEALKISTIHPPLSAKQSSQVNGCSAPREETYGQTVDALDQFYENASNRLILVPTAYDYVTAEIQGRPPSEKELQAMRRAAAR